MTARSSAQCASVAMSANANQTSRYPATNQAAGANGLRCAAACRPTLT